MESSCLHDLQRTRAIPERFHWGAHAFEHRNVEVTERRVLRAGDVAARVELPAGSASQNDWQVVWIVAIAVGET